MSAFHFDNSDSDSDDEGGYTIEEIDAPGPAEESEADSRSNLDFRMSAHGPPPGMRMTAGSTAANTGPKGVKADFDDAKRNLRSRRMMEKMRAERAIKDAAHGNLRLVAPNPLNQVSKPKIKRKDASSDESEEEESDDETEKKLKIERIQAVQNTLPVFGTYERLSMDEFTHLVKNIHELVYVVAHLYQNHLESCTRLNLSFENLAIQFPHVKFVRIRSTEAIANYSDVGLPTLLVYRGGEMITSAVRVTDALPKNFTDLDVAKMLQVKGILTIPTGEEEVLVKKDKFEKELEKKRAEQLAAAVNDWDLGDDDEEEAAQSNTNSTG